MSEFGKYSQHSTKTLEPAGRKVTEAKLKVAEAKLKVAEAKLKVAEAKLLANGLNIEGFAKTKLEKILNLVEYDLENYSNKNLVKIKENFAENQNNLDFKTNDGKDFDNEKYQAFLSGFQLKLKKKIELLTAAEKAKTEKERRDRLEAEQKRLAKLAEQRKEEQNQGQVVSKENTPENPPITITQKERIDLLRNNDFISIVRAIIESNDRIKPDENNIVDMVLSEYQNNREYYKTIPGVEYFFRFLDRVNSFEKAIDLRRGKIDRYKEKLRESLDAFLANLYAHGDIDLYNEIYCGVSKLRGMVDRIATKIFNDDSKKQVIEKCLRGKDTKVLSEVLNIISESYNKESDTKKLHTTSVFKYLLIELDKERNKPRGFGAE